MTAKSPAAADKHQRLIEAAQAELIDNAGHIEMLAVAKRAGVSTGLAYHHFGSKAGLISAVVDAFYAPLREITFGDAIPTKLEWREREKARTKALIDYFYDHPFAAIVAGRLGREPEVLDIENAHMAAMLKEGARNLAAGQKSGVLGARLVPEIAIAFILGGLRQAVHGAVLSKKRPARTRLLEQVWRQIEGALELQDQN